MYQGCRHLISCAKLLAMLLAVVVLAPNSVMAADSRHHTVPYTLETQDGLNPADGGNLAIGLQDVLVNAHGICRWLDNHSSTNSYFVPTKTLGEWQAFIDGRPGDVNTALCCPASNAILGSSDGQSQSFSLPVGRDGVAPDALGQQLFTASFNVVGGIETVTEEYRCIGTHWVGQGASTTFTPTACANTTACEGDDEVTRDCNGAIIITNPGACVAGPICNEVPQSGSHACGAGFNGVVVTHWNQNSCTGVVSGYWEDTSGCTPIGDPPICNDVAQSSSYPCAAGFTGNVITHWNQNTCTGAWSGYWEDTSGCAPIVCNSTSGCEGRNMVTRDCNGNILSSTSNHPSCAPTPVCYWEYGAFDADGFSSGQPYCNNFNLYQDMCAYYVGAGYTACDINVTVNTFSRCAADRYLCYIP